MTHTPGPWKAHFRVNNQRNQSGEWYFTGTNGTHEPYINLKSKFSQAAADARLIAAAPELLDFAKEVEARTLQFEGEKGLLPELLHLARAAIAKAEG